MKKKELMFHYSNVEMRISDVIQNLLNSIQSFVSHDFLVSGGPALTKNSILQVYFLKYT